MAAYPPPYEIISPFNPAVFTDLDSVLTMREANLLYIEKAGDTATGLINFNAGLSSKAGAVNAPSLYMSTDTTSGLYRSAANEVATTISGTQRAKVNSTGLNITGTINASSGTVSLPALTLNGETDTGFWRNGTKTWGFSQAGSNILTLNSTGIVCPLKVTTEQLLVGSAGGGTINNMRFGTASANVSFTAGQLQGPFDATFGTTFNSAPYVIASLRNAGGDPSQHVGMQVNTVSTTKFTWSLSNESALNIGANTYNVDFIAIN